MAMKLTKWMIAPLPFGADQGILMLYAQIDSGGSTAAEIKAEMDETVPQTLHPNTPLYIDVSRHISLADIRSLVLAIRPLDTVPERPRPIVLRSWLTKKYDWMIGLQYAIQRCEWGSYTGGGFNEFHIILNNEKDLDEENMPLFDNRAVYLELNKTFNMQKAFQFCARHPAFRLITAVNPMAQQTLKKEG